MEPIRRAEDLDGCGCLRCRRVDTRVRHRSIPGDILWAVSLLRRSPSLVSAALVVGAVTWLLWPALEAAPQTWPIGTAVGFFLLLSGTVLRAYVVAATADALQGADPSVGERFVASQRRLPAVGATLVLTVVAAGLAFLLASILSWFVLAGVGELDEWAGTAFATESIYDGASATLIFGSVIALAIFKLWLAPEICVAGRYGPLAALRLSWRVTSLHWLRVLVIFVGFAVTVYAPQAAGRTIAALGGDVLLWSPLTGLLQLVTFSVGYVIWFAVGTQIYVRAVLET